MDGRPGEVDWQLPCVTGVEWHTIPKFTARAGPALKQALRRCNKEGYPDPVVFICQKDSCG